MRRLFFPLSYAGFAVALVLVGVALIRANPSIERNLTLDRSDADSRATASPIVPASASVSLGEVVSPSRTPFAVTITNVGTQPVKLVGAPDLCQKTGCVSVVDVPVTIAPHQSAQIRFLFDSRAPGPVKLNAEMLFDVGTKSGIVVPFTLIATVSDSKGVR